jgi:hypothetical protein
MGAPRLYPGRAIGLALLWTLPVVPILLGVARCPSALLFHRACPGCGMTRAVKLALHGDVLASLRMHPVALPVALATVTIAVASVLEILRRGTVERLWQARAGKALVGMFLASQGASIVVWALRLVGLFGGPVPV